MGGVTVFLGVGRRGTTFDNSFRTPTALVGDGRQTSPSVPPAPDTVMESGAHHSSETLGVGGTGSSLEGAASTARGGQIAAGTARSG
jgi:hypothetical protein